MAAQKRPRTTAGAQADADDPIEGASDVGFRYEVCRTASFDTRGEAFREDSRTDEQGIHLERVPRASFVPSLTRDARDATKGNAGRVAVVGGCAEYAGAPFFAAISALRTGCDVAHVFCTESAAPVIRSFSPEIIAHPYVFETSRGAGPETGLRTPATEFTKFTRDGALDALSDDERLSFDDGVRKTKRWLKNMDALVIGPGLGRDPIALAFVRDILAFARETRVPTVIDADGLFLVSLDPTIARGNANVVLTPNAAELSRLARAILGENAARKLENVVHADESNEDDAFAEDDPRGATKSSPRERVLRALSDDLRGPAILSKGGVDLGVCAGPVGDLDDEAPVWIGGEEEADPKPTIARTAKRDEANESVVAWCAVREGGSPRRCGGQGDVLAGSLATFLAWASAGVSDRRAREKVSQVSKVSLRESSHTLSAAEKVSAAAHAARVTRDAARIAFGKKKRATTASDVAEALGEAFEARFPADRASYASSEERATSPKNEKRA